MGNAHQTIQEAYERLKALPGFVERENQIQLSYLISDCIEGKATGAFEAPTGLGKSLSALIPAIAHAAESGKRIVIATYTNVLAEQYWRKDLPLAMSLFEEPDIKTQFLIGRQRYACQAEINPLNAAALREFQREAKLGIESEFRALVKLPTRDQFKLWQEITVPPVCPSRLCPLYNSCYYYKARRTAEKAHIVITNHSVVVQDARLKRVSKGEVGMLGQYDFLIIDEAHDFPNAAASALEFELSERSIGLMMGLATRMETAVVETAIQAGEGKFWQALCEGFRVEFSKIQGDLQKYSQQLGRPGILTAAPSELEQIQRIKDSMTHEHLELAQDLAAASGDLAMHYFKESGRMTERWRDEERLPKTVIDEATEAIRNYRLYIEDFAFGCNRIFTPEGVSVSYVGDSPAGARLRHDVIGLAGPLTELLWSKTPSVSMSATLALDDSFEFYQDLVGLSLDFSEILPSPFDFDTQAALYLPPANSIPDPTVARREARELEYHMAIARELSHIINLMQGRTLALFHSRREMEMVHSMLDVRADFPVYMQRMSGAASVGERFKKNIHSSLFAVRSFWTGFDAPGETLSCVVLVRVPFEVPIDPPQVTRNAWLASQGRDPFFSYSLPMAKMIVRQGVGRLIRQDDDRGLIVLLDPRLRTKPYGESILANLPPGLRTYANLEDAVGWLGLG
ncbi:MAG: ATP-dependent DNA helicase [Fimbriimonadaceae bacterium]|nr:ATP-dependent DNA helicase [Fimbriimonadaceae bacterium]